MRYPISPVNRIDRRTLLKGSAAAAAWLVSRRPVLAASETAPERRVNACRSARAVTTGPKHHFFGYYDKCPWDKSGRYLLAMEIEFICRQPNPGEPLTVGMVDLEHGNKYIPLDTTSAWSWQQGTMLQWLGSAPDREVIYNSVADSKYVSIIRDVHTGKTRMLEMPIYAVSGDGRQAVSLNFDRVHRLRPGYGYAALPEQNPDDPAPANRGIYAMDLQTGRHRQIISIEWASRHKPDDRFVGAQHWFNHLQFNPSGTRFIFLHRWQSATKKSWWTRMYTAKPDGSEIRLLSDIGTVSHFDWRDDRTILAWTKTAAKGAGFYLIDDKTGEHQVFGQDVLTHDGHCSWSPDRKWVLNDTYPDKERKQTLMLYNVAEGTRYDLGQLGVSPDIKGPYRCDLHPRWNRDGTQVCVDSSHEPTRQLYVLNVSDLTQAQSSRGE